MRLAINDLHNNEHNSLKKLDHTANITTTFNLLSNSSVNTPLINRNKMSQNLFHRKTNYFNS